MSNICTYYNLLYISGVGEMRYANFANPEQRQEAYHAIRNRIQMQLPQQQVPFPRQPLPQPHPIQPRPPQQQASQQHPHQPHPAQQQVPQSHISIDIYLSGLLARRQNAWSQDGGNMRVIANGVNR